MAKKLKSKGGARRRRPGSLGKGASGVAAQGALALQGEAGEEQVEQVEVEAEPFEPTPETRALVDGFLDRAKELAGSGGPFHFYMDFSMFGLPDDDVAVERLGRMAFASLCSESDPGRAAGMAAPVGSMGVAWTFLDGLMAEVVGAFASKEDVRVVPVTQRARPRWAEARFARLLYPTPHGLRAL